jgi:hypothetical protein
MYIPINDIIQSLAWAGAIMFGLYGVAGVGLAIVDAIDKVKDNE